MAPAHTFSVDREHYVSTFTYTNAVPQCQNFNSGQWKTFENRIRRYAGRCTQGQLGTLYLLTGTSFARIQQGNPPQPIAGQIHTLHLPNNLFARIDIPNSLWTAGCCVRPNGQNTESFAVIGNNVQNAQQQLTQQVSVAVLQNILAFDVAQRGIGGQNVRLFPGDQNCLRNTLLNIRNLPAQGG